MYRTSYAPPRVDFKTRLTSVIPSRTDVLSALMRSRVICVLVTLAAFLNTACQMAPTKVKEVHHREFEILVDKAQKPLSLGEGVVVLDARSAFAYGLNHVTGALHFPWNKLVEDEKTGEIIRDKRAGALRLSLLGLKPHSQIIVVGDGPNGGGEEGRIAWTLLYFGFQDVQTASVNLFRDFWTPNPTPDPANAESWNPAVRDELMIEKEEFARVSSDVKGRAEKRIVILDARTAAEYLKSSKKLSKNTPDIGAINVPWTEFYTKDGRPNPSIRARLAGLGVQNGDQIIVRAADQGLAGNGASASYALMALGFKKVRYSPF